MQLPKFRPQWTADTGAKELYERYSEFDLAPEDFDGARYQRLAYLKSLLSSGFLDTSLRWLPSSLDWRRNGLVGTAMLPLPPPGESPREQFPVSTRTCPNSHPEPTHVS